MSRIIECQVNDEYILGSGVPIGAAGSFGDVILRLSFNETWDGLNIVATFKDALGQSEQVVMLLPSMLTEGEVRKYDVPIPRAAKITAGRAKLTLSGYSTYSIEADGTKTVKKDSLTNTATAFFRVLESDSAIVDDESVDASLAEQLFEDIEEIYSRQEEWARAEEGYLNEEGVFVNGRVQNEEERVNNEEKRETAEQAREAAEDDRKAAENERETAEEARQAKDAVRDAKIESVQVLVGDIDSALDAIIAIQESLIGGGA